MNEFIIDYIYQQFWSSIPFSDGYSLFFSFDPRFLNGFFFSLMMLDMKLDEFLLFPDINQEK